MINADMRTYSYYTLGELNEYGLEQISTEPTGSIKMAIYTTSQTVNNTILYTGAQYIGLTQEAKVNDTYVIEYGAERLKVLYVQSKGKFKQVFMCKL